MNAELQGEDGLPKVFGKFTHARCCYMYTYINELTIDRTIAIDVELRKSSVRTSGIPANIQNEHILNTSLNPYGLSQLSPFNFSKKTLLHALF